MTARRWRITMVDVRGGDRKESSLYLPEDAAETPYAVWQSAQQLPGAPPESDEIHYGTPYLVPVDREPVVA